MQILSTFTLCLGKFWNGFFVTIVHVTQIKMINETVPVYLLSSFGPVVQQGCALGYLLVMGLGMGLPIADYNPALVDDVDNLKAMEAD
mmetsp:Transcript_18127/g.30967  ORF Transcript_18127/g.30967 Transcript_18127/m.30967 type:complete len:88 (+) Transcript_18127:488-751(+)